MELIIGKSNPDANPSSPHLKRTNCSNQENLPSTYTYTEQNKNRNKTSQQVSTVPGPGGSEREGKVGHIGG